MEYHNFVMYHWAKVTLHSPPSGGEWPTRSYSYLDSTSVCPPPSRGTLKKNPVPGWREFFFPTKIFHEGMEDLGKRAGCRETFTDVVQIHTWHGCIGKIHSYVVGRRKCPKYVVGRSKCPKYVVVRNKCPFLFFGSPRVFYKLGDPTYRKELLFTVTTRIVEENHHQENPGTKIQTQNATLNLNLNMNKQSVFGNFLFEYEFEYELGRVCYFVCGWRLCRYVWPYCRSRCVSPILV